MRGATFSSLPHFGQYIISIHAPHARSDLKGFCHRGGHIAFQSTLLMRGATRSSCDCSSYPSDFNPRSSCEERPNTTIEMNACSISIHAPHARSDCRFFRQSARREISIHAPHARSDAIPFTRMANTSTISIHAPHARSDELSATTSQHLRLISIHAPHARSDVGLTR